MKAINDNRMALWRTEEFKDALRKVIKETLKKEKDKVPNKYASRVYRQMYFQNVKDSKSINFYEKIMLHPDCTKADYYYIEDKSNLIDRNIKISTGVTLTAFAYLVIRKNLIELAMKSPGLYVPILGILPISVMAGS